MIRTLRTWAVSAVVLSSVAAQDPAEPTEEEEIPIPVSAPGGTPFQLGLLDAMRLGLENNTALRVGELAPYQIAEDVRAARAAFEPEVFADVTASQNNSPQQAFFQLNQIAPAISQEVYTGRFGIRQLVPSGGLFDVAFSPTKFRQSSTGSFTQYTTDLTVTLTQPLLRGAWSDYGLRQVQTQEAQRAGSAYRYERTVQETLVSVIQAYWDLVFTRENYRVAIVARQLAAEERSRTQRKIDVGELARADLISDDAEVARREEELVIARNDIHDREDDLRRLIFDDADGELWMRNIEPISDLGTFPDTFEADWRELARVARRMRPDLRALKADVAVAEIALEAAERDVLPRLDLVGSYTSDGVASNYPDAFIQTAHSDFEDWSVQLQFAVPIGNNAALAARDRARLEVERTRRVLYSAEMDVDLEVRDAVRRLRTLAESIRTGQTSVALAESNLEREIARRDLGASTSFEVQQRNQELKEARQRLLRNQLDYRIAEAQLLSVQGILDPAAWADNASK